MEISEIIRLSDEEDERKRGLGIDDSTLDLITANSRDLLENTKGLDSYAIENFDKTIAKIDNYTLNPLTTKPIDLYGTVRGVNDYSIENLAGKIAGLELTGIARAKELSLQSPIFNLAQEANRSALNLLQSVTLPNQLTDALTLHNAAVNDIVKLTEVRVNNWQDITKLAGVVRVNDWKDFKESYAPQIPVDKFLTSHISQITQTSVLAQSALAGIEFGKIGSVFNVADEIKSSFNNKFVDFSSSYKDLFKSFEVPETSLFRLPPSISELPTIEFFNGVDLLEMTVEEENQDDYEDERIIVREEIRESTNDSVIIQLREINEDWITMLEGARQAFSSSNPDKTRHCITSLRELVREIMHYLSPDDEIKGWSSSPDDFANKRPTRKARLRYITRNINHGAFTKFVEKDIEAILAAIDIFQAGTHVANSKLTEAQIAALIARIEGAILFLFSIANYEE